MMPLELSITSFLTCLLMTHHQFVVLSNGQNPPKQTSCKNRPALLIDNTILDKLNNNWVVGYATPMKILPLSAPNPPNMNSCTPLTYLDSCKGAIYVKREFENDGGMIAITRAYSSQFKDIVELWESLTNRDDNNFYAVFSGFGTLMKLHRKDSGVKTVPLADMSELIYWSQAQTFAITARSPKFEWQLFQACDVEVAWIEFTEHVVQNKKEENLFNNEIIPILKKKNIQQNTLVKLPRKLPFKS